MIDRQRLLERGTFTFRIAENAMRRRQVDPVRPLARLSLACLAEMHRGRSRVGARQSVGAQPVARGRLFIVDRDGRFEMGSRLVAKSRLAGALALGQMLLDAAGGQA